MVLTGPHPAAFNIAYLTGILRPKAKLAAFVGSYGWGGNLFGKIQELLAGLKIELIEPLIVKGKIKKSEYEKLDEIVEQICEKHQSVK